MSCPAGSPWSSTFEVKSLSGSASDDATPIIVLKLSTVEHSTRMRAGRSALAHTTAESVETSPEASPLLVPSSNHDENCPLNWTLARRYFASAQNVLRQADDSTNRQKGHSKQT